MLIECRVMVVAALLVVAAACGGSAAPTASNASSSPSATSYVSSSVVATRIRFAQCMRQQGITDFPDPDPQGRFTLPPSLAQGGNLKSSPRWPQVQQAMNGPCHRYDPSGHI